MAWLRRLWHSRDWMLIPLGAIILVSLGWWLIGHAIIPESDGPRWRTDWTIEPGEADAGPTVGMTLSAAGYGTVTQAPPVEAAMAPDDGGGSRQSPDVAPDVARFLRAWPREVRLDRPPGGELVCTLEGPAHYAGKLVLVDGCLRFQAADARSPGPLVLAGATGLFRDEENYLSLGAPAAPREYRLRVGEPGGVLIGVGCSMDGPVPAPRALAEQCGVGQMIRLGTIKRKPVCSSAYLERRRQLQRQEQETTARLRRERAACVARTGAPAGCPPDVIPANMELFDPPCRLPVGADQASQGSSTQPNPSR